MSSRLRKILIVLAALIAAAGVALAFMMRGDTARFSDAELSGRVPILASPKSERIPTVNVAKVVGWPAGQSPKVAPGLTVQRFAEGLDHPRSMLVLPNGDVLVAETNSPPRNEGGVSGMVMKRMMDKAGAGVPSANRITLLRDANGDGVAELKTPYLTGLVSPYGMVLIGDTLYVANTNAVVAFPYDPAATKITAPARKIADLPASGTNRHWTKSLTASPDGKTLYLGVGANSNIAEFGMAQEQQRAAILSIPLDQRKPGVFASGLRNPVGMAFDPDTQELWTVVNERDQLGSDLVPDYLARVRFGDFYGWPWYYWGGFIDYRVKEIDTLNRRQYTARPEYALGAHVAPLGMTFAKGNTLGDVWAKGVFVALHGSWNRKPASGYSIVFVPFGANGKPTETLPMTVMSGFLSADQSTAWGRPTDVKVARDGSLLVADDSGNMIWRVAKAGAVPAAAPSAAK